ncbi:MAG: hypothetical protein HXS48_20935 [Theionarchaea archaeon]|nr:hypothetical protein [Theionarchaea archaeon]
MKTIRFSHEDYEKFRRIQKKPPFTARLLQVFLLHNTDVSDAFREYDTKYYTEEGVEYYSLHGRVWIVLLLETDGLLFTTMRTANASKVQYYQGAQGEEFEITARRRYR